MASPLKYAVSRWNMRYGALESIYCHPSLPHWNMWIMLQGISLRAHLQHYIAFLRTCVSQRNILGYTSMCLQYKHTHSAKHVWCLSKHCQHMSGRYTYLHIWIIVGTAHISAHLAHVSALDYIHKQVSRLPASWFPHFSGAGAQSQSGLLLGAWRCVMTMMNDGHGWRIGGYDGCWMGDGGWWMMDGSKWVFKV